MLQDAEQEDEVDDLVEEVIGEVDGIAFTMDNELDGIRYRPS